MVKEESKNTQKHKKTSEQCIKKKLYCRVQPSSSTPHTYQKIHWDKRYFPENIEKKKIKGKENSKHSCLKQKQEYVIFLDSLGDYGPGRKNCKNTKNRCHQHKKNTYSVNPEKIKNFKV